MSILRKFSGQNINPTKDMIMSNLKGVNTNNLMGSINTLCSDGYIYENDGHFYLN